MDGQVGVVEDEGVDDDSDGMGDLGGLTCEGERVLRDILEGQFLCPCPTKTKTRTQVEISRIPFALAKARS